MEINIKTFKELAKKVKIIIAPSPYRIIRRELVTFEWEDYDTAQTYLNWLKSGENLEEYYRHQQNNFPLFIK